MLKQTLKYTAIMACIVGLAACGGNSGKSGSLKKQRQAAPAPMVKKRWFTVPKVAQRVLIRRSTQQVRRLTQPPTRCTTPWHNSNVRNFS